MAQLRDAATSSLIAEGDALEVALIARAFTAGDTLPDSVGKGFDADRVIEARRQGTTPLDPPDLPQRVAEARKHFERVRTARSKG